MRRFPFFSRERQAEVVASKCECGHLESQHGSQLRDMAKGKKLRLPHDGNCLAGGCKCERFVWECFVTAEEADAITKETEPSKEI